MLQQFLRTNRTTVIIFVIVALVFVCFLFFVRQTALQGHAGTMQEKMKGRVVSAQTISKTQDKFQTFLKQQLQVVIKVDGREKQVPVSYDSDSLALQPHQPGDEILLTKTVTENGAVYVHAGRYRVERVLLIVGGFLLLVLLAAGSKGLGALAGLAVNTVVIIFYIIPQILSGVDPLYVVITGSMINMFVSIYLAHGISKQTTVALISTLLALLFTYVLSWAFVNFAFLSGFGTEEAYNIHQADNMQLQIQALLVGGILIATLGALDDVTTAQAAAIFELAKANKQLSVIALMKRGMVIGREHMISLVNTLIIAYIGSSLMLFISYFINYKNEPLLAVLNREPIAEAIVKTIAVSTGLVLALPIVTALAAYVVVKDRQRSTSKSK